MTLRIEFDCYCEHICECTSIPGTKITNDQIAYNLIRCNPSLARYFSKTTIIEPKIEKKQTNQNIYIQPIAERKDLHFTEDASQTQELYPIREYINKEPPKKPEIQKPYNHYQKQQKLTQQQQKQALKHLKELKLDSRYLSDTAFRKHFNRQVFQNYGRNNTSGIYDGIIYGNYLKTHNINPHSGDNNPADEETYYQALINANALKIMKPETKIGQDLMNTAKSQKKEIRLTQDLSKERPLRRHQTNLNEMLIDNIYQHSKMVKYEHLKISKSKSKSVGKGSSPANRSKSPNLVERNTLHINEPIRQKSPRGMDQKKGNIQSQYVNQKQHIQSVKNIRSSVHEKEQILKKITKPNTLKSPQNVQQSKSINNQLDQYSEIKKISEQQRRESVAQKHHNKKPSILAKQQNLIKSQSQCPVDLVHRNLKDHILSSQCHHKPKDSMYDIFNWQNSDSKPVKGTDLKKQSIKSPIKQIDGCYVSNCNGNCEKCEKKVKNEIKKRAIENQDLANRLIASAKKQTLYKNYSLNNVENGRLNPHNYHIK